MKHPLTYQHQPERTTATYCITIFSTIFMCIVLLATITKNHTALFFCLLLFDGFLSATYLEYHLHRFWTYKNHHRHPSDIRVTPIQRTIMGKICLVFFIPAVYWNNYFTLFTGFIMGCSYSFISHWMLHQRWVKWLFPRLLKFHMYHHSKFPNHGFGFSCPWWDILFKTAPPADAPITNKIIDLYFTKDKLAEIEQNN
jgi:sterol desaturase/sphingolipid hydroxylase (fatty acid hydroxylase superfamily)